MIYFLKGPKFLVTLNLIRQQPVAAALEKKVIHTEKTMIYNLTTMGNNLSKKKLRPRFFREMNLVLKHGLHVSIPSICKVFLKFHSS